MKLDYFEYRIASHYLSALVNGDHSGLDDSEEVLFTEWLDAVNLKENGTWHIHECEEVNFTQCEVSGLDADCAIVRQYFPITEG